MLSPETVRSLALSLPETDEHGATGSIGKITNTRLRYLPPPAPPELVILSRQGTGLGGSVYRPK